MTTENDDLKVDPDYLKGFNEAYTLAQDKPELAKQLNATLKSDTPRSSGFKSGYKQYELDNDIQRQFTPDWGKDNIDSLDNIEPTLDKDDLQPET